LRWLYFLGFDEVQWGDFEGFFNGEGEITEEGDGERGKP
jgi:hypothetical protein|tara:strand:- start:4582 stop:4698 length:117 start_codon:yes stop_codon:yes gene_type:complete